MIKGKKKKKRAYLVQIGENIRARRKILSISQEGLALVAELDRSYVGGIERGERNITVSTLILLSLALKTTVQKLVKGI